MAIDVTISDGDVRWSMRCLGNEWREQLPLASLVPYPTTTIDRSGIKLGIGTVVGVPLVSGLLLWWFGITTVVVIAIVLVVITAITAVALATQRGPLEWVSFDTFYPDKSVYMFRNTGDIDFDTFTDRLREAILASGGSCSYECDSD